MILSGLSSISLRNSPSWTYRELIWSKLSGQEMDSGWDSASSSGSGEGLCMRVMSKDMKMLHAT